MVYSGYYSIRGVPKAYQNWRFFNIFQRFSTFFMLFQKFKPDGKPFRKLRCGRHMFGRILFKKGNTFRTLQLQPFQLVKKTVEHKKHKNTQKTFDKKRQKW